jgi:hypothetical protein
VQHLLSRQDNCASSRYQVLYCEFPGEGTADSDWGCSEITPQTENVINAPRPARRLAVFACFLIHRMVVAHRSTHRECDVRLRKAVAAGFGHGIMRLSDVLDVPRPSASPQSVSMVVCMVIHGCLVHTCFCFIMFYQPNTLVLRL